jgi:hypothetical protein
MKIESNISINCLIWDFGFRYDIASMDVTELRVLMLKYETEFRRSKDESKSLEIIDILGKIYEEIMKRNMDAQIEIIIQKRI